MTNLENLKNILETDPFVIARNLFICMECPKLKECCKVAPDSRTASKMCRVLLEEWLKEECENV